MKKRLFFLAASLLLLLGISPTPAGAVETCAPIRVGYFSFSGFHDMDENDRYSGYGYEYLQELAKYTGWTYEYVTASWDECLAMLERGEIDLLGSAQRTTQREAVFDFAKLESGTSYAVLCALQESTLAYEDFAAFDGMTVGVMEGNSRNDQLAAYCQENGFSVTTVSFNDQEQLLEAFHGQQVDAVLTSNLRKGYGERIVARFSPSPFYFMTTKGNTRVLEQLNHAQAQIKMADPYFDTQLYDKYYAADADDVLVFTQSELDYLETVPTLRVVYDEDWAPISYNDSKTKRFSGITATLFKTISNATGIKFSYLPTGGLATASDMIYSGQADLIAGVEQDFPWSDRYDLVLTSPYLNAYNLVVTAPHYQGEQAQTVALPRSYLPQLQYDLSTGRQPDTTLVLYDTTRDCFDALLRGEADLTYTNTYVLQRLRGTARYARLTSSAVPNLSNSICVALPKKADPRLLSVLNKTVRHISDAHMDQFVMENTMGGQIMSVVDYIYFNPAQAIMVCILGFSIIIGLLMFALRQRSSSNKKIYQLLYVDEMTGIWNFNRFSVEGERLLRQVPRPAYALVYTDIDRFKYFNDTHGYEQGNQVLNHLANLLKTNTKENEIYARVSSDNFVALLVYTTHRALVERLQWLDTEMNRIQKNDREYYRLTLVSGVHIITPEQEMSLSAMLDRANSARKQGKGGRKGAITFYDEHFHQAALAEQEIETYMETALASGQFVPYYQPQFNIKTGQVVGMEALVRWTHPVRGLIFPDLFIPLFERNGFIVEMDFYIFGQVCRTLRTWIDQGKPCVAISSNFSRVHLRRSDFAEHICQIADSHGVPHNLLQIEITESAAEENPKQLIETLKVLRKNRFSVAMDDFGSGYSSLNLLKTLPVDTLKLDKDFLQRSVVGQKDRIVIEGFVTIARKLELTVICEGVETEEQAAFLLGIDCNIAQGYLYARPVPLAEAEKIIAEAGIASPLGN